MRGSIKRRTVYAGTIVAMLALAGGFALASTFVFNNTASQGQNGYSVQTTPTMWVFGSATASSDPHGTCSASPQSITIATPGTSPAALSVSIPGASGGACSTTNFAEDYNFSASVVKSPTSDLFTVISVIAVAPSTCSSGEVSEASSMTVTTSQGTATATTVWVDLWVDYGPATTTSLCNVDIAVSGT